MSSGDSTQLGWLLEEVGASQTGLSLSDAREPLQRESEEKNMEKTSSQRAKLHR